MLRIGFAGSADFSVPFLEALLGAPEVLVPCVLTRPDKPGGRGQASLSNPLKRAALAHGLEILELDRLSSSEEKRSFREQCERSRLDLMVLVAYGAIIPRSILEQPPKGWWNVHASLLPRWRGAAPIARSVQAGEVATGVTLMKMEAGLDTGPYALEARCSISSWDTAGSVQKTLEALGPPMLLEGLARLQSDRLTWVKQDEEGATYADKLGKAEARVDWSAPAQTLERLVRAFNPWPVAWFESRGCRIKILEAYAQPNARPAPPPGTVLKRDRHGVWVQTGEGSLVCTRLQLPGARALPWRILASGGLCTQWGEGFAL